MVGLPDVEVVGAGPVAMEADVEVVVEVVGVIESISFSINVLISRWWLWWGRWRMWRRRR